MKRASPGVNSTEHPFPDAVNRTPFPACPRFSSIVMGSVAPNTDGSCAFLISLGVDRRADTVSTPDKVATTLSSSGIKKYMRWFMRVLVNSVSCMGSTT
jgi:hypothetical protein